MTLMTTMTAWWLLRFFVYDKKSKAWHSRERQAFLIPSLRSSHEFREFV